jgi:phosphoenolpyruvate-protein kinase (PTS system EI component)
LTSLSLSLFPYLGGGLVAGVLDEHLGTASGGPLFHGAVTAREMRIPAVMAVRGCLSRLENGRRIRVEEATGRVTLL